MPCKPMNCQCGKFILPQRYLISLLLFLGVVCLFNMRVSLNIVINSMVKKKVHNITEANKAEYCPRDDAPNKTEIGGGKKNWTEGQQSFVRASFYIGYVPAHLPAGLLSDYYGGRLILSISMIASAAFTFILPFMVQHGGWGAVGLSRIIVGIAQGLAFPAVSTLLSKWVPKQERAFLGSFAMSGSHVGTITGTAISGLVTGLFNDWTVCFYLWAITTLVYCIALLIWVHATPADSPFVLPDEKEMLLKSIPIKKRHKTPLVKILIDIAVIAMTVGQFGHAWVFFTFNTDLPKYMDEVLAFDIKKNGLLSSIPSLGMWLASIVASLFSDWLFTHKNIRILTLRRVFTAFGNVVPSIFCVLAGYMGCNKVLAVIMFTLVLTMKGPFYCGIKVNYLDITANYAGMVCALNNGIAALAGAITPYVIGFLVPNHSLSEWRLYFWVTMIITIITTVFYWIFTADERRPWDYLPEELAEAPPAAE